MLRGYNSLKDNTQLNRGVYVSKKQVNMLSGPLFKNIVVYTIPIILTGALQMLFNTADLIVIGQFRGGDSVGAVGATSSLTSLLTNFFIGFSVGSGVSTAHAVGSGNNAATKRTVSTAMATALVCSVIVTIIGVFASEPLLVVMGTPEEIIDRSALYMKIYFSGTIAVLVYNFGASILRAVGETKKPLIYLSIAGVTNVILNIVFVTVFHMDVEGVALATILSQVLSAMLIVKELITRKDSCRFILKELRFHKKETVKILALGIPTGIQSCVFSVSNVLIQSSVNGFGIAAVAGNSAASSIENFTYIVMNSFQQAAMNFTGQNFGAGKIARVKRIFGICMGSVSIVGLVMGSLTYIFGKQLLGFYVGRDSAAIEAGITKLFFVGLLYFLCGLMEVTTGTLRGMGTSLAPMITAICGVCIFRIGWNLTVFNLPQLHTLSGLFVSYPISWVVTGVINFIIYCVLIRKLEKKSRVG